MAKTIIVASLEKERKVIAKMTNAKIRELKKQEKLADRYPFRVEIDKSENGQFYSLIVSKTNGKIGYQSETIKRKQSVLKTVNAWFPGVEIVDRTKA